MIPVIGIVHYKNLQLTENCLRSIPDDVYRELVIVDNSEHGTAPRHLLGKPIDARYISFGGNLGVAHAWNTIIKATPGARYWFIINSDLEFIRSDFERLETAMMANDLVKMGGYEAFGIHRRVIKQVGWFDENYHPAYCEDNDYHRRAELAGVVQEWIEPPNRHIGSATIMLDPVLRERNTATYAMNVEYHMAKWGGPMHEEVYETPFNKPTGPAHSVLDIDRLAGQHWTSEQE